MELAIEHLRAILDYSIITGLFINKVQRGQRGPIGSVAGSFDKDCYVIIQINGTKYKAHRLAWFYVTGTWPIEIDHWDGVNWHNAWHNLRDCTRSENVANSNRATGASGLRGVKFDPKTSTWRARIAFEGYREWLGPFDTAEEAFIAYSAAAENTHGEFALQNRPLERRI